MRSPYELDTTLGLEYYSTSTPGVGGKLRYTPRDFCVEEVPLPDTGEKPGRGPYLHFTLEKLNWDTMQAINALTRAAKAPRRCFGYAGNKDKRALTRQRVSAYKVKEELLRGVSIPGIELSNFSRADRPIVLGDLAGNRFRIIARLIDDGEFKEKIQETRGELEDKGIPNYFGYQRFGVIRANTHLVGRELVKGQIKEAVMKYLGAPYPGEKDDAKEARAYFDETLDCKGALERFPERLKYERAMLRHLAKNPRDYAGALRRLPRKLGILLVHAYQSYLFNKILSRAIEEELELGGMKIPLFGYGTQPEEGPLGELGREVLETEGIVPRNFWIRSMPELSTRGFYRDACIKTEIRITPQEDELNPGREAFTASFTLPKGCYATVVMREFMKTDPINY
jgi:tRNA pseudouridine13 synthase